VEERRLGRWLWVLSSDPAGWVRADRLRISKQVAPPPGAQGKRWIHVDRAHQLLTAYEGNQPVYSTLISSGRRQSATPAGIYRIWAKLATGTMSDEGTTIDDRPYLMQGVPWIMYFNEGVAFHGAYWHDDFGRRRSHGCVNLAPRDAAFLFHWAQPELPRGWTAILPTRTDQGSLVVVE
jgi:hypothetical protein